MPNEPGEDVPSEPREDLSPLSEPLGSESLDSVLAELFAANERVSREQVRRRAVAAELPAADLTRVAALPDGEYAEDELREALRLLSAD